MTQEKTISDLAYHLWHARGCPSGSSEVDWIEAERQVRGKAPGSERALEAPVPAGEPVAVSTPEQPPSSAAPATRAKKKTKR